MVGRHALVGLLLPVADERDGVQPDRRDAADAPAKALMAVESTLSAITVLLVAARGVNILA
jgi:hypothetical protein